LAASPMRITLSSAKAARPGRSARNKQEARLTGAKPAA
jgi:hypothetical protein